MKTITTQFMLRSEAVTGLNLGKKLLMLSTKKFVKPINTTLGTVILENTQTKILLSTQTTWSITRDFI
jgi:hypothetical protein